MPRSWEQPFVTKGAYPFFLKSSSQGVFKMTLKKKFFSKKQEFHNLIFVKYITHVHARVCMHIDRSGKMDTKKLKVVFSG